MYLEALRKAMKEPFVIMDTETTGLNGEACEIAIINSGGVVLMNTLIKTVHPIPADVVRIHGISNEMIANAPTFRQVWGDYLRATVGKQVIIYNAQFDTEIIKNNLKACGMKQPLWDSMYKVYCAMLAYAEYRAVWNDYRNSWKWHKLTEAASQQGIKITNAHRALGDCLMTLEICKKLAE